jgi:hypothetical protein
VRVCAGVAARMARIIVGVEPAPARSY